MSGFVEIRPALSDGRVKQQLCKRVDKANSNNKREIHLMWAGEEEKQHNFLRRFPGSSR
jgi:hypothetical protein